MKNLKHCLFELDLIIVIVILLIICIFAYFNNKDKINYRLYCAHTILFKTTIKLLKS